MRRWLTGAAAVIAGMLAITFGVLSGPLPAQATDAHAFDPAEIISDANFYDANAMTAADVQNFLNQHVPTCHPEWDGSLASTIVCLKDYHQQTTAKSADAYCSGYSSQWQSAAQIIDGVARSCGISQKVILVTLQKESALVNHPDPSPWRYTTAMGYGCPDDAPCDAQYNGLFNQIYNAARQFKLYQAKPSSYQYRAGQNNYIQWNPNAGCGGSTVYIRNQATAALYDYTPYQPNAAALNAGYGTGDSCSTYGNRNFFLWYSDWFGSPTGYPTGGAIGAEYWAMGGPSWIGSATANELAVKGGASQTFQGGTIFWSAATGAHAVRGAILGEYASLRYEQGLLGFPTSDEYSGLRDGGFSQAFQNGQIHWSPATGAHFTRGGIQAYWAARGWQDSWLGYPTGDELAVPGGVSQTFQGGTVWWNAATGTTFAVRGSVLNRYAAQGWERGGLGYPTSDELSVRGGVSQTFQGGTIFWQTSARSAFAVRGALLAKYATLRYEQGPLGFPQADELSGLKNGGYSQLFLNGTQIHWSPASGAHVTLGGIQAYWARNGWENGWLGYPTGDEVAVRDGSYQTFQGGTVWWSSLTLQASAAR
ncbi:MAG: hypothetical protein ABF811_08935 [Pseudoclavibacter sp.]